MKTWTLKVNETELQALIEYHRISFGANGHHDVETSARIHDLTKRLNRETPEVEGDPRPTETKPAEAKQQNTKPQEASLQQEKQNETPAKFSRPSEW